MVILWNSHSKSQISAKEVLSFALLATRSASTVIPRDLLGLLKSALRLLMQERATIFICPIMKYLPRLLVRRHWPCFVSNRIKHERAWRSCRGCSSAPVTYTGGAYTYNAAGCVTTIDRTGKPDLDLTWNGQYQLTSVSTNGVVAESYAYDPLGRRASTTSGGVTVRHVYDGVHCAADTDATGTLLRSYTWENSGVCPLKIPMRSHFRLFEDLTGTVANPILASLMKRRDELQVRKVAINNQR